MVGVATPSPLPNGACAKLNFKTVASFTVSGAAVTLILFVPLNYTELTEVSVTVFCNVKIRLAASYTNSY